MKTRGLPRAALFFALFRVAHRPHRPRQPEVNGIEITGLFLNREPLMEASLDLGLNTRPWSRFLLSKLTNTSDANDVLFNPRGVLMKSLGVLVFFFSISASAVVETITIPSSRVLIQKDLARSTFSNVQVAGLESSKKIGEPALPVKSYLVSGLPQDIQVSVTVSERSLQSDVMPMPVQAQPCRCADDRKLKFEMNEAAYRNAAPAYELTYLGAFRGQPITRLDVRLASYDSTRNAVTIFNSVNVDHSAQPYSFARGTYNDYLIVVPASMADGIQSFAAYKKSQGFNVIVESLQTPQITIKGISDLIAGHYKNSGTDFVLLVGDENALPMHMVNTSGSYQTPSDLNYYTMDGKGDTVPDLFFGRIAATSVTEVSERLNKAMEFEKTGTKDSKGLQRVIGIASNEGSNPSDDEYVTSIGQTFQSKYGYESVHFQQDDSSSIPSELNNSISSGAAWLFYMGHGSGYSWPSMYREYDTNDIAGIENRTAIKPVIIDVACANGRLLPGYLGTSFSDVLTGDAFGAAAYYGGTVNISWHPPAVMAQGLAQEHAAKNFRHLGEALLAGQLHLAANWNNSSDVIDNLEWYILQGDPSMIISQ